MRDITLNWVNILIPYTKDYNLRLTATDISKETKTPQQTVSRILNRLEELNLINYIIQGKNKLFYFDLKKSTSKTIINLIELKKTLDFQLNRKKEAIIINELLNHCESIILFGSYAIGEQTKDSDLDILIINGDEIQIKKMKKKYPIQINEHHSTIKKFEELIKQKNNLSIEIKNKHILFNHTSKITNIFME